MPVVRIESSSGGEIPALLKATFTLPKRLAVWAKSARTSSSEVTAVATNSPPTSAAAASGGPLRACDPPAPFGRRRLALGLVEAAAHVVGAFRGEPANRGQADPA